MPAPNGTTATQLGKLDLIKTIAGTALEEQIEPQTLEKAFVFTPPIGKGQQYRVIVTNEMDAYDKPTAPELMLATPVEMLAEIGDDFGGKKRKAAKISIGNGPIEHFADLKDLIATLPTEAQMANHVPNIGEGAKSARVAEEQRNVRLRVWIYAASREDDNDFHLILGRKPGLLPKMFMTMELSGLPPSNSPHFAKLKAVRDTYKAFFAGQLPGTSYQFYAEPNSQHPKPIPVEIEGSLFFDITHSLIKHPHGSRPGPQKLRPDMPTIWEVHPISKITFEP